MLFKIVNGAVSIGATDVLEEINFEIKDKEKIAVVGRNGAGKSTLLKVITGEVELSDGIGEEKRNLISSGQTTVGYLKQNPFRDESATMLDEVLRAYEDIISLEKRIESLALSMENAPTEQNIKAYSEARDSFELLGGYYYKKEYETAIKKFGFTELDKSKKISEFSGGQRTRIALLCLLLSKPDILLLDEPTNHLDVEAIEWLQDYLAGYKKSMVLVSHDRMFLDRVVNVVYEIEYGATTRYNGNYTKFIEQKRANYEKQLKDHEAQAREIDRLRRIADRFRYKPTKASMALSKLKQIERMSLIDAPNRYDMHTFHASFQPVEESVERALTVKNLKVGYGEKVLAEISIEIKKGEKVAVIGGNGTGKSTFLKTLTERLDRLGGSYEFGVRVNSGYFEQQMANFTSDKTVFENFADEFPRLNETEVRNSLASFGFYGEDVFKKVSVLSGGEKVSLALCKIFKRRPNFLILDEPTNHMDIVNKETLERMLSEYKGTVLIVSHDRYLVDKVADRIIAFENGGAKVYDCRYSEYESLRAEEQEVRVEEKKVKKEKKEYTTPLKELAKKKARIGKLEKEISLVEEEINLLDREITKEEVYSDYKKLEEIECKRKKLSDKLESLTLEYLELAE